MSAKPPVQARYAPGGLGLDGIPNYYWALTLPSALDPVLITLPPKHVLPVVFVPGIMGSNLKSKGANPQPIWRLDAPHGWFSDRLPRAVRTKPMGLVASLAFKSPGYRQSVFHPDRTEVDPNGYVPDQAVGSVTDPAEYRQRGWGEVGDASYVEFLLWLEQVLNGQGYNPAKWAEFSYEQIGPIPNPGEVSPDPKLFPGIPMKMRGLPQMTDSRNPPEPVLSDDLIKRAGFRMPVYACGYNWLADNQVSATRLKDRIQSIIQENNTGSSRCEQVVVVTHSMGGLVARCGQTMPGMRDMIAGVVHGVMPATGAAVAYRRCKIGMRDEDWKAGLAIGKDGPSVTAVFAQSPGALELLPFKDYGHPSWLSFGDAKGQPITDAPAQPTSGDPYTDIYLRADRWWGLVRPEWLHPPGGRAIKWNDYKSFLKLAQIFTEAIHGAYHPQSYVFYAKDNMQPSFAGVHWAILPGGRADDPKAPVLEQVPDLEFGQVEDDGSNPLRVGSALESIGSPVAPTTVTVSDWVLQCAKQDSGGDGTVPAVSGAAPLQQGGSSIHQQFALTGFGHEEVYRESPTARLVTLYGICKIAAKAKVPSSS